MLKIIARNICRLARHARAGSRKDEAIDAWSISMGREAAMLWHDALSARKISDA